MKDFVFEKNELRLFLSVMCGLEVPPNIFVEDKGVFYEHFIPPFQYLALIIRSNIFPNTSHSKLMTFAEIRLMHKLASHKVHFNLSYLILLQMINGYKKGYMLYGLLLTKVFEFFKLNVTTLPYFSVKSTISDGETRTVVPLAGVPPPPPPVINLDHLVPSPMSSALDTKIHSMISLKIYKLPTTSL